MASNKELTEQADSLGKELGLAVKADGLNNAGLTALVADLQAQKAKRDAPPPPAADAAVADATPSLTASESAEDPPPTFDGAADPTAPVHVVEAAPQVEIKFPYQVAPGLSISCKIGIVDAGEEMRAEYLSGAKAALDSFVASGHVLKREAPLES